MPHPSFTSTFYTLDAIYDDSETISIITHAKQFRSLKNLIQKISSANIITAKSNYFHLLSSSSWSSDIFDSPDIWRILERINDVKYNYFPRIIHDNYNIWKMLRLRENLYQEIRRYLISNNTQQTRKHKFNAPNCFDNYNCQNNQLQISIINHIPI